MPAIAKSGQGIGGRQHLQVFLQPTSIRYILAGNQSSHDIPLLIMEQAARPVQNMYLALAIQNPQIAMNT